MKITCEYAKMFSCRSSVLADTVCTSIAMEGLLDSDDVRTAIYTRPGGAEAEVAGKSKKIWDAHFTNIICTCI